MDVEPNQEYHLKGEFLMSSSKTIILEMKLELLSMNRKNFPENYKFSWIDCNKDNPEEEFILFDNYHKAPHFHIDQKKEFTFFAWISKEQTQALFFAKVEAKFGSFLRRTK